MNLGFVAQLSFELGTTEMISLQNMHWKLFVLLVSTPYVMGFNEDSINFFQDHPHWKLVEKIYDAGPEITYRVEDVGEPLILTAFIKRNQIMEAREAARVDDTHLMHGIESYAGYFTVNEEHNSNLWFWYFPVLNTCVDETPLIVWLQGGPGATSLFGLFKEIGPFNVDKNKKLHGNKYSWGQNYSLLFIDNPVGTGFSFTDRHGYARNQTTIGENLYSALQQFLTIFPELRMAPLYLAGESYAGKHVPSLGIQIHWHKDQQEPINFQGIAIGNGFIDPITLLRYSSFARELGFIDDETAKALMSLEDIINSLIQEGKLTKAFMSFGEMLSLFEQASNLPNEYNFMLEYFELLESIMNFVRMPKIRKALHVGNTSTSGIGTVYSNLIADIMNSTKPWLEELLNHYRVMVYSGHLDCRVPYRASVNTYQSLNYAGAREYKNATRYSWHHNGILAGYYKEGGNLLEVMVRGAGHMVPIDKPAQALGLITAFIENISLDKDTGNLVN